jgi:hypothetical protein
MEKHVRKYLIVTGRGDVRVVTRQPRRLPFDEVAFPLNVTIPHTWGRFYPEASIDVSLPEPDEVPSAVAEGPVEVESDLSHPEAES